VARQQVFILPRIDDYTAARNLAIEALSKRSFNDICLASGFETAGDRYVNIPFLNRCYRVSFPEFEFQDATDKKKEVPIQEQVLILHYLMAGSGPSQTNDWISYREIPGASFYFTSFVKRAIDPLKNVFGQNPEGLEKAAVHLKGKAIEFGDVGLEFCLFPRVYLQLILWVGDDEFPPEANILFNDTIGDILSPEDIAWLSGMLVYRLIALSR
jgi:hypothetical protein